jgi:hypothetical protein
MDILQDPSILACYKDGKYQYRPQSLHPMYPSRYPIGGHFFHILDKTELKTKILRR